MCTILDKPRGYEAPEWNNANEIMRDQARQIGSLQGRIEKHKAEKKRLREALESTKKCEGCDERLCNISCEIGLMKRTQATGKGDNK